MKYILILCILISCNNNKKIEKINKFNTNQEINISDTSFMINDRFPIKINQKLIIFSNSANDSLFGEFDRGLKKDNYTPGCEGKPMNIIKSGGSIKFNLFLIAGKEDHNKIVFSKFLNDTAFVRHYRYKVGKNQNPWFHKIQVLISDQDNKINYIFLESED